MDVIGPYGRDGNEADAATPAERSAKEEWKAAGVDWDEVARFAATLPLDPVNSVVEMRKQAPY